MLPRMRRQLASGVRTNWPLLLILAAAVTAFAPALTAPFWLDDYFYLLAARELSTPAYVRAVVTPWGSEPLLPFTRDFWRPLAFLWFELLQPLAGGNPLPYHLLVLAGHLAAVVLVWLLAARIDSRRAVRTIAAGIVAVYPGTYQAVAWISSVNSLALPLALGAWLAFLHGTDRPGEVRWRPVALAALLLALAVMTRESGWVALPVIAGWHLAVTCRWQLRSRAAWLPLLPFAALAVAYAVIRTRLFTEPLANREIFDWGSHAWRNYRTLLELLLFPFRERIEGLHGWRKLLQELSSPVIPLLTLACILLGRWRPAVLLAGALISLLAVAPNLLGIGPRYLYFTVPWIALGLAILAADLLALLPLRLRLAAPAVGILLLGFTTLATFDRVDEWTAWGPGEQQQWVDALRAAYPALPSGATVYCTGNVPGWLTLFDGVNLAPAVRWYYPEAAGAVYVPPGIRPQLGPGDVLFVAP